MGYKELISTIEGQGFKRTTLLNRWCFKDIYLTVYIDKAILHYNENDYSVVENPLIKEGSYFELKDYISKYFRRGKIIKVSK